MQVERRIRRLGRWAQENRALGVRERIARLPEGRPDADYRLLAGRTGRGLLSAHGAAHSANWRFWRGRCHVRVNAPMAGRTDPDFVAGAVRPAMLNLDDVMLLRGASQAHKAGVCPWSRRQPGRVVLPANLMGRLRHPANEASFRPALQEREPILTAFYGEPKLTEASRQIVLPRGF